MRIPTAALAAICAASLAATGCALLVPPSWREGAPLPLAGEVDTTLASGAAARTAEGVALDPSSLSDERLLVLIEEDRDRLVELAAQEQSMGNAELREIADRLPLLLHELRARGAAPPGSRIQHPVIR